MYNLHSIIYFDWGIYNVQPILTLMHHVHDVTHVEMS